MIYFSTGEIIKSVFTLKLYSCDHLNKRLPLSILERRKMGNPALACLLVMTFFSSEVMRMNTVRANNLDNLPKDTDFSEYDDTVRSGGKYAITL